MIIWSGLGILVPIVAFLCFLVTQLVTTSVFGDERYYTEHGLPKLVAFWIAAVLVFLLGRVLDEKGRACSSIRRRASRCSCGRATRCSSSRSCTGGRSCSSSASSSYSSRRGPR